MPMSAASTFSIGSMMKPLLPIHASFCSAAAAMSSSFVAITGFSEWETIGQNPHTGEPEREGGTETTYCPAPVHRKPPSADCLAAAWPASRLTPFIHKQVKISWALSLRLAVILETLLSNNGLLGSSYNLQSVVVGERTEGIHQSHCSVTSNVDAQCGIGSFEDNCTGVTLHISDIVENQSGVHPEGKLHVATCRQPDRTLDAAYPSW